MKQANLGLDLTTKKTRKREFLEEMERVVPLAELVALADHREVRMPPVPDVIAAAAHVARAERK